MGELDGQRTQESARELVECIPKRFLRAYYALQGNGDDDANRGRARSAAAAATSDGHAVRLN